MSDFCASCKAWIVGGDQPDIVRQAKSEERLKLMGAISEVHDEFMRRPTLDAEVVSAFGAIFERLGKL